MAVKFCEQCGSSLAGGSDGGKGAAETPQAARYAEAAKQASSMYFSYCLSAETTVYRNEKRRRTARPQQHHHNGDICAFGAADVLFRPQRLL
ncbi:hypothetical protein ACYSTM_15180 [Bacillus licheniformis]